VCVRCFFAYGNLPTRSIANLESDDTSAECSLNFDNPVKYLKTMVSATTLENVVAAVTTILLAVKLHAGCEFVLVVVVGLRNQ
jgi:hypothetical protein